MKLSALTAETVARAIAIYQELAYGPGRKRAIEVPSTGGPAALLAMFQHEPAPGGVGQPCCRYTLRLGNRNYPFMKLLLQEHLVPGEFYFGVDTHDQLDIKPDFPDHEQWLAVRRFNRELKQQIEQAFARAGLDTAATLRRLLVGDAAPGAAGSSGVVLVVDDEEDLADAVGALFARRGWRVVKVHDGAAAVAAASTLLPDLVLLDYELPELDGLEVLERLRGDVATQGIPVLLSSAARVALADAQRADGFLAKPFPEALLFEVVDRVLRARGAVQ